MTTPVAAPPRARSVRGSPGPRRSSAPPSDDVDDGVADERVQRQPGVALRAEQEERRDEVIETAAAARDDEHPLRPQGDRLVQGELEVGRVLRLGVTDHPRPRGFGRGERFRVDRVEVADHDVDRARAPRRARGRRPRRPRCRPRGRRPPALLRRRLPRRRDRSRAFLRWHYPDQVLRVGGAVAALSAQLPRGSPVRSPYRSRADGPVEPGHDPRRAGGGGARRPRPRRARLRRRRGRRARRRLRASWGWTDGLSLVAERDGELVGHVLFTRSWLDAPERLIEILVLSPLSVAPEHRGGGIGERLVREGLAGLGPPRAARRPRGIARVLPAVRPRPAGALGLAGPRRGSPPTPSRRSPFPPQPG